MDIDNLIRVATYFPRFPIAGRRPKASPFTSLAIGNPGRGARLLSLLGTPAGDGLSPLVAEALNVRATRLDVRTSTVDHGR